MPPLMSPLKKHLQYLEKCGKITVVGKKYYKFSILTYIIKCRL